MTISPEARVQIKAVKGYSYKQSQQVDEKRETVRQGNKKAAAVSLTKAQADLLKAQPDTSQGRRDALLTCLLLDHGLRCGEVAGLTVVAFDLEARTKGDQMDKAAVALFSRHIARKEHKAQYQVVQL
ncbi:MAG: hypothetical protein ABI947_02485 [Chloroflexota bacterium]